MPRSHRANGDSGAVLVEFAITLPLLVMLLLGMFTGGIVLNQKLARLRTVCGGVALRATLAVAASVCSSGSGTVDCWLKQVADVTESASEGRVRVGRSVANGVRVYAYLDRYWRATTGRSHWFERRAATAMPRRIDLILGRSLRYRAQGAGHRQPRRHDRVHALHPDADAVDRVGQQIRNRLREQRPRRPRQRAPLRGALDGQPAHHRGHRHRPGGDAELARQPIGGRLRVRPPAQWVSRRPRAPALPAVGTRWHTPSAT